MRFLLDTDTCIYAMKEERAILHRLISHPPSSVGVSVITEAELRTGASKSSIPARTSLRLERFLAPLALVDFNSADAAAYAEVRARLERTGKPIGPLDTLIAAQAISRKLTLVSNNVSEFRRVPGLSLENWRK